MIYEWRAKMKKTEKKKTKERKRDWRAESVVSSLLALFS